MKFILISILLIGFILTVRFYFQLESISFLICISYLMLCLIRIGIDNVNTSIRKQCMDEQRIKLKRLENRLRQYKESI